MTTNRFDPSKKLGSNTISLVQQINSDDSIQIVVEDKSVHQPDNQEYKRFSDLNSDRKKPQQSLQQQLKNFRATINERMKSKNEEGSSRFGAQTKTINVDGTLAPSLHTRSKGSVKMVNQFIPKISDDEEKQFKPGRYQFGTNNNKKQQPKMKQSKLSVINLNDSVDSKKFNNEPTFKLDGPIYPWRKKAKPQPHGQSVKGLQYNLIKSNGFHEFEKNREQRKKEKQQQRKKQKEKEEIQKQQRFKHLENTFSSLLGLDKTDNGNKKKDDFLKYQQKQSEDEELKNLDLLEKIENEQLYLQGNNSLVDQSRYRTQKRLKYGLDEVVRPYDSSHGFPFVKAILGYKFSSVLQQSSKSKRIPDVFPDSEVYKKTFHYLVINECIADIHQRMKKFEKASAQKIEVEIGTLTENGNGMIELKVKQVGNQQSEQQKQNFLLKNYSMSKNRIGVITNKAHFSLQNYGLHSSSRSKSQLSFSFLCTLKTPQSKQQLKDSSIVVSACINPRQLQFIMELTSSRRAYFYDAEKLSTNIREYMSISNVQYSWLSEHIYNPKFIDSEKRQLVDKNTRGCIDDVLKVLQKSYNLTQFQSIREMVLRERGIVLLQGPPGTGKTSTLLGLLSAQYAYLKRIGDKRKIMICAPSNAAIDHITKRIRTEGLTDGQGVRVHPNVLRLGIVQTEDKDITSCSLDHICQSKIVAERNKTLKESQMTTIQIRERLSLLQKKTKNFNAQIFKAQRQKNPQVSKNFQIQLKQTHNESIRLENLLYSFRRQKIISKKLFQELQKNLLRDSQILIVTLSSSGGQKMEQVRGDIACLIVDQAAQATQPSLLIALQTGVDKVMLIGDPYQLPATTLSTDSNKTLFNRSLFERFIDSGIQPYFLNIQYRMMPMIREFPSDRFYQERLVDGQSVVTRKVPEELSGFAKERSVIFIDIKGSQEKVQESSFCNHRQAYFITKLLKRYRFLESDISVGLITPYQAQKKLLLRELGQMQSRTSKFKQKSNPIEEKFPSPKIQPKSNIMINTIDSFQGQQKDLILISTVRSNDRKQIGFLMDERRINVSITRAKYAMIIIGNGDTMGSNEVWDGYLQFIEGKKLYFEVNSVEDQEKVLANLSKNDFFNEKQVRRRFYDPEELTSDPRKIKRSQIGSADFKKLSKKRQTKANEIKEKDANIQAEDQSKYDSHSSIQPSDIEIEIDHSINVDPMQKGMSILTKDSLKSSHQPVNSEYPFKKGPIPLAEDLEYQAEELIRKKRKKQEETKEYERACERLKYVEKQKANDDFYKFLFQ